MFSISTKMRLGCCFYALVFAGLSSQKALATNQIPSSTAVSGQLVSPQAAFLYYGTSQVSTNSPDIQAAPIVSGPPREITELANELGAQDVISGSVAAQDYTNRVFNYVRMNIETSFTFGLTKGAYGTFVDQAGTDLDQSALMIALLNVANISAIIENGTITLNAQQFGLWTGLVLPTAVNADGTVQSFQVAEAAACQLLANGGMPANIDGSSLANCGYSGTLSSVVIAHAWVNVNGARYDPSYKVNILYSGANLASAMGCGATDATQQCTSQLLSTSFSSANSTTSNGVSAINHINTSGFAAQINTYGQNLASYIQQNGYNRSREWLLGGKRFDVTTNSSLSQAPIGYVLVNALGSSVPDQYRIKYSISADSINSSFWADEIAARRLRIFSDAGNAPITSAASVYTRNLTLYVDWIPIANSSNANATGQNDYMNITVNYPYAAISGTYLDFTYNRYLDNFSQYPTNNRLGWPVIASYPSPITLVHQFGPTSQHAAKILGEVEKSNYLVIPMRYPAMASTLLPFSDSVAPPTNACESWDNVGNTHIGCWQLHQPTNLQIVLSESSEAERLIGEVGKGIVTIHGEVGAVAGGATSIEPTLSVTRYDGNVSLAGGLKLAANAMPAWFEGGVNEQTQNLWEGVSGLSLLFRSMQNNIAVLDVNSGNVSAALSQVTNFAPVDNTNLINVTSQGFNVLLPQNMSQSFNGVQTGTGFGTVTFSFNGAGVFSSDYSNASYLVRFIAKGGSAPTNDPLGYINKSTKIDDKIHHARDNGTINLGDGSPSLKPFAQIDIGSGDFPDRLGLGARYSGSAVVDSARLVSITSGQGTIRTRVEVGDFGTVVGPNWKLNVGGKLTLGSDGYRGMGSANALEASSIVPALYALVNIGAAPTSFQNRIGATLSSYYAGEQLVQNSVDVELPSENMKFVRLPNGNFSLPGGKSWIMKQNSSASGPYMTSGDSGAGIGQYIFGNISFDLVNPSGDDFSFAIGGENSPALDGSYPILGFSDFVLTRDTLSSGKFVSYSYSLDTAAINTVSAYSDNDFYDCMNGVSSFNGHSLSLTITPGQHQCAISQVSDETGRNVSFGSPNNSLQTGFIFGLSGIGAVDPVSNSWGQISQSFIGIDSTIDTFTSNITSDAGGSAGTYARLGFDLLNWTHAGSGELAWSYNSVGQATSLADANAHSWTYRTGASGGERWHEGRIISPLNEVDTRRTYDAVAVQHFDPLSRSTVMTLNEVDQVIRENLPGGGAFERTYDIRGNMLTECRVSAANGSNHCNTANGDLLTTTVYMEGATAWPCSNPRICNKPSYVIDPKGNRTDYSWCNAANTNCPLEIGEPYSVMQPADVNGNRPTITYGYTAFNNSGGPTFYLMTSKQEKINASTSTTTTYTYNPSNHWVLWSSVADSGGLSLQTCYSFDAVGNLVNTTEPRAGLTSCP